MLLCNTGCGYFEIVGWQVNRYASLFWYRNMQLPVLLTHCGLGMAYGAIHQAISEPMLTHYPWGFVALTWEKCYRKCSQYQVVKWVWNTSEITFITLKDKKVKIHMFFGILIYLFSQCSVHIMNFHSTTKWIDNISPSNNCHQIDIQV